MEESKISYEPVDDRPSYGDFFRYAGKLNPSGSDLVVIANSDIYFDTSILVLAHSLKPNQCAILSRWDVTPEGDSVLFDRNDSQDVWIFRGPLKKVRGDFPVGVPRCDNRFMYELKQAGYEVINPAFSVRAYHLHSGPRQEYSGANLVNYVDPPYAYLWPHNLYSLPRTLLHNIRHPDARLSWRLDRRKLAASLPVRALRKAGRILAGRGGK